MARFCTECGSKIADGIAFCTGCGAKAPIESQVQQVSKPQPEPGPIVQQPVQQPIQQTLQQPAYQQPQYQQPIYQQTSQSFEDTDMKGTKYEPISTWGYIGIMLLLCIPLIGLVLMIVWACGGCRKINKRNLCRSMLIMLFISIVLGLIISLAFGGLINAAFKSAGVDNSDLKVFSSVFNFEKNDSNSKSNSKKDSDDGLLGGLDSLFEVMDNPENENSANSDLEALGELGSLLGALGSLTAESGLGDLINDVDNKNAEAEKSSNGWPKNLRKYPNGNAKETASYRTEISDTTLEDMKSYISDLKKDGYKFQDFYNFGFSEDDMLNSMHSWWGTNGNIYLSISYLEGSVTIDHTYELPDLSSYLG